MNRVLRPSSSQSYLKPLRSFASSKKVGKPSCLFYKANMPSFILIPACILNYIPEISLPRKLSFASQKFLNLLGLAAASHKHTTLTPCLKKNEKMGKAK